MIWARISRSASMQDRKEDIRSFLSSRDDRVSSSDADAAAVARRYRPFLYALPSAGPPPQTTVTLTHAHHSA